MKTYIPIHGMIVCARDTGDYVEKTDYDRVEAELATERARLAHIIDMCKNGTFYHVESIAAIDAAMKEATK